MSELWGKVKYEDVLKAIKLFEKQQDSYPKAKNTFLIYNNKEYPAKHIRGLAYKIVNKTEISKSDYSGGEETANFFKNLGFNVEYKKNTLKPKLVSILTILPVIKNKNILRLSGKKLNVVSQKNALQKLLQKHFGCIEIEKKFNWLKTPDHTNLPNEYRLIAENLLKYRNHNGFLKSNYSLSCDIVLEDQKLIIEYDENQHFTKARQICLENYPAIIQLSYSKETWLLACQKINAKDNFPIDRDERRAYNDTVRDIEAYKNGYTLLRIKHGDVDWEVPSAEKFLKDSLSKKSLENNSHVINHMIARLIIKDKQCTNDGFPIPTELSSIIDKFLSKAYEKQYFEFILTPGGFLRFNFPKELQNLTVEEAEKKHIPQFQLEAEKTITNFLKGLRRGNLRKLQEIGEFLTIGIDGYNTINSQRIELIAVYDLNKETVIRWTGKFYPTEQQKRHLIKINDFSTHFINLGGQNIIILGCHDLNVFNPRGRAAVGMDSWKRKISEQFSKLCKQFNPDIILQLPHKTDTPNIWNLAWRTIEKELPNVKHFASGINYYYYFNSHRSSIDKVLSKTKKGDVIDFIFD